MKPEETTGQTASRGKQGSRQTLRNENLRSRREFLKRAVKKCTIPAIVVYSVHKMAPPAFGRTPI